MEFTDENKFSQSKIRKDGSETRHHRRSHRRSSSILKVPQSKLPLSDLDVNQQDECRVPPSKKARKSENRRVSFADTCQIKEFPKDSPGVWHQENSSLENSPNLENTIEQEKPEISGLDKLLTGNIQHPGFASAEEAVQEVPLLEENQVLPVDPVNHTIIVDDEMELTGLAAVMDAPADDFGEMNSQNNKVDYDFLRSLVAADKKTRSCLYEDNIQSSLSVLTTGTTTLSSQTSTSRRAPLMAVSSSQKSGIDTSVCVENIPVELDSDYEAQPAEKPKATGFLQSLLKNQSKNEKKVVLFSQSSSCSTSQHDRTQIFGSGDGMDETTVLDSTIWTMEKRDSLRNYTSTQNHVTLEKIHVENTCVFHNGDAMEETKVISGQIWTKNDICLERGEKTQIFSEDGELDMMEETKVLDGRILTESNLNVTKSDWMSEVPREEEEKTKIFDVEDGMEETRVLTGGIWTGENGITDKTGTQEVMKETQPLTGSIRVGQHTGMDDIEDEKGEKTKIFVQDDMEETEVVSISLLEIGERNQIKVGLEVGNDKKLKTRILDEKSEKTAYELKEDDSDEEITFNIKKTLIENETFPQKDDKMLKEQVSIAEPTDDKLRYSENAVTDKENGNTRSLADLKARLKEHTTRFDDNLLRPDEKLAKSHDSNEIVSQMDKSNGTVMFSNKSAMLEETKMMTTSIVTGLKLLEDQGRLEDVDKPMENKTVLFNDKSELLEETKMVTASIETGSHLLKEPTYRMDELHKPLDNKTLLFSDKSVMLEETKMVTTNIETNSKLKNVTEGALDTHEPVENKTVLFDNKSAMMEETKAVTSNLQMEAELPSMVGGSVNQMKGMSETVESLPKMASNSNMTIFFGNDTGAMEQTGIAATSNLSQQKNSFEGGSKEVPLTETSMLLKAANTEEEMVASKASDQFLGLMDNDTQGLLEQAPPENLLTDLTLNSTGLSLRPPSTSSPGVAASSVDSTQALLGKDWDNITLPTDSIMSIMMNREEEKSLISQLSINKTVDCDTTQEILEGPPTALSLCNYLHVIKPSCLKVSKVTELRKTRCSFVQEEEIICEDLKSKLSALLTIQPHIEAQMAVNAQLSAEVERKKIEHEALEESWQNDPPAIFHHAQTCSQSQKEDLRDRMMVMSNVCTRQGKIEWKKAGLQAARLELEIMQECIRKRNLEVEQTIQMASEAVRHIEQANQDIQEIEREIQELQQMPDQSEEEVHQYQSEKNSLEKKQADLLNLKSEEQSFTENNQRLAEEYAALAERLSESVRLDTEKEDTHTLEVKGQQIHQEIQLLCGKSGWQLKEDSFRSNHKIFTFGRKKFQMDVIHAHNEDKILSIELKVCDEDVPSRIDQFCYSLVVDTANGQYLKHKYSRLSDLPQILDEVGSLVSHVNDLQRDLMLLQLDHCISYRYPSLNIEVWSPKKRCAEVSFLFQSCAGSLLWGVEPSVDVLDGNFRKESLLARINQNFRESSCLNKVCAAIDLDSIPEETRPKCPVCGTI
uniref:Uncharacterized protein LOC111136001 isoform X3 n=1 Tax=Crassostrea virginica TaxID=6565 RepID=A0A8B8EQN4_CRAVI|nr:uncharacterized protein LOC111136001 isoform X3 [Crassostrea virginica]